MREEFIDSFSVLDINTKRNYISNELMIIYELIKEFERERGIEPITMVKNYDTNRDAMLTEGEMLTFLYEDVYNIQQELVSLLNLCE